MTERLAKLNALIYKTHREACELKQQAELADFQYKATREGVTIEYKSQGLTELEAKAKAYKDNRVIEALNKKLDLEFKYQIKRGKADGLIRRWNDEHAQNKTAYGYEVREAVNN